jgi:integrase
MEAKAAKKSWVITPDKFLTLEQVEKVTSCLRDQRDLAAVRRDNPQAIKDYYMVRTLLESGLRVFEFCALTMADFHGHRLAIRHGKGDKPRTVILTKGTAFMLKEWLVVREQLGFATDPQAAFFPSR